MDALLFDMSNRMARTQLQRQFSSGSTSYRGRPASRVTKPTSAGSSPHCQQRRRATTTQQRAAGRILSEVLPPSAAVWPYPPSGPSVTLAASMPAHPSAAYPALPLDAVPRPLSWHPASLRQGSPHAVMPQRQRPSESQPPTARTSMPPSSLPTTYYHPQTTHVSAQQAALQGLHQTWPQANMAAYNPQALAYRTILPHGLPTPLTCSEPQTDLILDPALPLERMPGTIPGYPGPTSAPASGHLPHVACDHNVSDANYPIGARTSQRVVLLGPSNIDQHQQAGAHPQAEADLDSTPPTPELLPLQGLREAAALTDDRASASPLELRDSKDLVGMGLYDNPYPIRLRDGRHWGVDGSCNASSVGTGLKLEDAWEPPLESDRDNDSLDGEGDDDPDALSVPSTAMSARSSRSEGVEPPLMHPKDISALQAAIRTPPTSDHRSNDNTMTTGLDSTAQTQAQDQAALGQEMALSSSPYDLSDRTFFFDMEDSPALESMTWPESADWQRGSGMGLGMGMGMGPVHALARCQ